MKKSKSSFTHYYVQAQEVDGLPEIVHHTYDEEEKVYYYKFLDRKQAKSLAEKEKKASPETNFRVVKCTETFEADEWF